MGQARAACLDRAPFAIGVTMRIGVRHFIPALLALVFPGALQAQENEVPYWASLSADEVYMRVGPSPAYRIAWVYTRERLPVKVIRVNQGWRYVEDPQGTRGWMAARLLSRRRAAIVTEGEPADMRAEAGAGAPLRWHVEPGVVGDLGECAEGWCEFEVEGHRGFIAESRLWGAGEP